MKMKLAIAAALAAVLASPAFAAPKHQTPVSNDTMNAYGAATTQAYASRGDVVMFGNRVVGEDPDPNIRSQLLHDPEPSEY